MMVQRTENGQITNRLGKLFEHNVTLGSFTKHYQFGGRLIAMREGLSSSSSVSFFATDHLGSTAATIWANGSVRSQLRYDPWGKQRYALNVTPTGYRYTSQRWDSGLGLYDYNARYYDPHIGRFISADTLVPTQEHMALTVDFHNEVFLRWAKDQPTGSGPSVPQSLNRYAYVINNSMRYVDPTGHEFVHVVLDSDEALEIADGLDDIIRLLQTVGENYENAGILAGLIAALGGAITGASAIEAVGAFLATLGIGAGTLLIAGILIAFVTAVGGAVLLWEGNARQNAANSLSLFTKALRSASDTASLNSPHISLAVYNNFLAGDRLVIQSGERILYDDTTSVFDKSGRTMISVLHQYADLTGKRITYMYWYGVYDYSGNGQWSKW